MQNNFLPYLLLFAVTIVFMFLLPQRKLKKEKDFRDSLKIGDKVITIGGIHGKVVELAETTLIIETMSGKLKIERSAISVERSMALNVAKK